MNIFNCFEKIYILTVKSCQCERIKKRRSRRSSFPYYKKERNDEQKISRERERGRSHRSRETKTYICICKVEKEQIEKRRDPRGTEIADDVTRNILG